MKTPTGQRGSVTTADAQDGSIADTLQDYTEALSDILADVNDALDGVDGETVDHLDELGEKLVDETDRLERENEQLVDERDELRQRVDTLEDRLDEVDDTVDGIETDLDELDDYVNQSLDYGARERAELASRVSELEESTDDTEEGGSGDETPTPSAGEDTLHATVQTPLGDIVTLPDSTAERGLSANERRARSVAKDVVDYASKVQAGYALTSSEIRTVLSAQKEDGRAYTETVRRVIDKLTTLGKDDVELNESLGDKKVVVFTEEFVKRTVSWREARSNGVVIGTEVETAT